MLSNIVTAGLQNLVKGGRYIGFEEGGCAIIWYTAPIRVSNLNFVALVCAHISLKDYQIQ